MTVEGIPAMLRRAGDILAPLLAGDGEQLELTDLLQATGWHVDALTGLDLDALAASLKQVSAQLGPLLHDPPDDLLEGGLALGQMAAPLGAVVDAIASWSPPSGMPEDVGETLVADLGHALIDRFLWQRSTLLHGALRLTGVIRLEQAPAIEVGSGPLRDAQVRPRIDLAPLHRMVTKPGEVLEDFFSGLGEGLTPGDVADAVADVVGPLLTELLRDLGVDASYGVPGLGSSNLPQAQLDAAQHLLLVDWLMPTVDETGDPLSTRFRVVVGFAETARGLGLVAGCSGAASIGFAKPLLRVEATATEIPQALILDRQGVFLPDGSVPTQRPEVRIELTMPGTTQTPVALRVGNPGGTRFEIGRLRAAVTFDSDDPVDVGVLLALEGVHLAVSGGDGDGFLSKTLPRSALGAQLDLEVDWSMRKGLRIRGGSQIDARLPLHVALGPLHLVAMRLGLGFGDDGVEARVALDLRVELGPVKCTVERFGVGLALEPAEDGAGALGPVNPRPRLLLPLGVGLKLGEAAVTGGGYLYADHDAGLYAGVLRLEIKGGIAVTAIGLISTKLPDGSRGFSLLVVIAAEFPAIQLGFGFTLNGLGGLLGANRRMDVDALRKGVRSRVLDSILFPPDPVTNATKVIADLQSVFPIAPGRFVIGLMARIGWGTPTIISVDLGVVLELPAPVRIAILGRLSLQLPQGKAVVQLKMDILGILDFDRREASIDATLHDSRIAMFTVTGDMAVRLGFGASPAFALSAGGFNRRFTPPPDFPPLNRMAIALATGDNPRLTLQAYFAKTPATVQFGARLDVYAAVDAGLFGFFEASGYLSFDALIQPFPPSFAIDITGGLVLRRNGSILFGIELWLTLTGPTPWRACGEATFHLLGKRTIPFDVTIGRAQVLPPLPAVDPLGDLVNALGLPRNWTGMLPAGGTGPVTVRPLEPGTAAVVHPQGSLTVRQEVLPLNLTLTRYQNVDLAEPLRFDIQSIKFGPLGVPFGGETRAYFATGDFVTRSGDENLSQPAYESFCAGRAGIGFDPDAVPVTCGRTVARSVEEFDQIVIDQAEPQPKPAPYGPDPDVLAALAATAAAARAPTRTTGVEAYAGPPSGLSLREPGYRIVRRDTGEPASTARYETAGEAYDVLSAAADPVLQVVGAHEVAA